jgi:hypothetical protein
MSDSGEQQQVEGLSGLTRQQRSTPTAFPTDLRPIVFEGYTTLNVKQPRAAIQDHEMAWCDGWMPLAPNVVRILPDAGPDIYAAPGGARVVWMGFGNIGETNYGYVLLDNGRLDAFNTETQATIEIMSPGAITSPSSVFGFSQWGATYALFSKDQVNGYWLWDGTNLFTAGTINPEVELKNTGEDYSSLPSITYQTTGGGTGAVFTPQIDNGSVVKITATNPGSGFDIHDLVALNIQGGGSDNQALPAVPTVHTDWAGVKAVTIIDGGQEYTYRAYGTFTGGAQDPSGDEAICSIAVQNGTITEVAIVKPGSGYTQAPTLTITDPGIPGTPGTPGGSGFIGVVQIAFGQVTSISIADGGSGYVAPPEVRIIGDGTGATGLANIEAGQVISVTMTNYGEGYSRALAVFLGGNKSANALATVFPFGISGTAIETYQSRVWISNGGAEAAFPPRSRVIYSDPDTPTGFGNGGGAFKSNDSFLRVGYHWLRQSNGFLYLGGDSSTNYISGVSTSAPDAGVPVTTFSNQNVDPQIGSGWPSSVQVFSRNIVLANPQGIHVSYGGAMTKVSTPLDPLFSSCPTLASPGANFSSAVAQIFNVPVYMLLLPVIDAYTGDLTPKLLMWDGTRWFTSQQSRTLTYIATQEVNSELTAWGSDGTRIFRLFQKPSTAFTKRLASKLFSTPGYYVTKWISRLQGVYQSYVIDDPLEIAIDSSDLQSTPSPTYPVLAGVTGSWFGLGGGGGSWTGLGGDPGAWTVNGGVSVFGPIPVDQWGRMLGYTITTTASDLALMSLLGEGQDKALNV